MNGKIAILTFCSGVALAAFAEKSLKEPIFALPVMRTSPVVDGRIDESEWKDAHRVLQFIPCWKDVVFPGEAQVWFGRDRERFYVAARMLVSPHGLVPGPAPVRRHGNGGEISAFNGDCMEIDFSSNKDAVKETVCHIIVSNRGAYYSTGTENSLPCSWDPLNFQTASTVADGFWNFEFSVPLEEIKFKDADAAVHGVRIARDWKYYDMNPYGFQSSIAPYESAFEKAAACCRMPFDDEAPVVQMTDLGLSGHGGSRHLEQYPVKLRVSNIHHRPLDVRVKISGKPVNSQPVLVEMPATLAPGEVREFEATGAVLSDELVALETTVSSGDGSKVYYSRWFRFQPNFGKLAWEPHEVTEPRISLQYAHFPSEGKIRVRADLSADAQNGRNAKIVFSVLDDAGRTVNASELKSDENGLVDAVIPTGDLTAETKKSGCGRYRLVMSAAGVKGGTVTNVFWRENFDWEGNKIGLSKTVPAPFEKVKKGKGKTEGEEVVKTVLREHTVDAKTGLWKQVNAVGKDILARPISLVSGNRTIEQSNNLSASAEWDVDGMMKWTLTLKPGHYEPMSLVVPIRAERARLMHSVTDGIRITYAGAVPAGEGVVWKSSQVPHVGIIGDYVPYIWIGGPLRGIAVFGDNDRGWVTAEGVNHQQIVREKDGTVKLILNLIQKPVEVSEDRTIVLGFQATPTKPMPENWRQWDFGVFLGSGKCWGCQQTDADVCPWDGTDEFWRKLDETKRTGTIDEEFIKRTFERYRYGGEEGSQERAWWTERVQRHVRSGFFQYKRWRSEHPYVWYTNARGVDFSTPQGRTYADEWNRQEWFSHDYSLLSHADYDMDPCASFRDYAAWWYKKMIESGACMYLYWDDIYPCPNYNLVGTSAYRLDDGTIQPSAGLFNMRELIRRCAVVQAELGKPCQGNWVHMTSTAVAPLVSFAGVHYDLEDGGSVNDFQDRYGRDYLLASTIGRQHGNVVRVMGYSGKTTPEEAERLQRSGAGVMMVHEISWPFSKKWVAANETLEKWGYRTPDVRVWNYWDEDERHPLVCTGEDCVSIAMAKKSAAEAMIVVCDWAEGGTVNVKPDCATLGIPADFVAVDVETGKPWPVEDGVVKVALKRHDYAMIRLRAK